MGQQQLLLIVLGVILVGIAVVVGINLFTANATETKRNNVINDCITLATFAQQHWKKPGALGGGNKSFDGSSGGQAWSIPPTLRKNANGSFVISGNMTKNEVIIIGTGNEVVTGNDSVKVSIRITPEDYFTSILK